MTKKNVRFLCFFFHGLISVWLIGYMILVLILVILDWFKWDFDEKIGFRILKKFRNSWWISSDSVGFYRIWSDFIGFGWSDRIWSEWSDLVGVVVFYRIWSDFNSEWTFVKIGYMVLQGYFRPKLVQKSNFRYF